MIDVVEQVPLYVAAIGVLSALLVASFSRHQQREHQQRETMMEPSEEYARKVLEALSALRYITPPPSRARPELAHRNEELLIDKGERAARIARCEQAVDAVRATRAHVRLVFHPDSVVAYLSARVLVGLRNCLETAIEYYKRADMAEAATLWRDSEGSQLRDRYKEFRRVLYTDLDLLFDKISVRLSKPLRKYARFD